MAKKPVKDATIEEAAKVVVVDGVGVAELATPPDWAVDTPDPHVPWPDPRPEPSSDAHDMDFGDAIRCLKRGQRVARAGWNGKGMWLVLALDGVFKVAADWQQVAPLERFIAMFTAQKNWVPWLASQSDVLADDWRVVG
jgi:hypothetical protein